MKILISKHWSENTNANKKSELQGTLWLLPPKNKKQMGLAAVDCCEDMKYSGGSNWALNPVARLTNKSQYMFNNSNFGSNFILLFYLIYLLLHDLLNN